MFVVRTGVLGGVLVPTCFEADPVEILLTIPVSKWMTDWNFGNANGELRKRVGTEEQ